MSTIVMKAEYFTLVFSHRLLAACSIAASLLHSYAIVQNRNLEMSSSTFRKYVKQIVPVTPTSVSTQVFYVWNIIAIMKYN